VCKGKRVPKSGLPGKWSMLGKKKKEKMVHGGKERNTVARKGGEGIAEIGQSAGLCSQPLKGKREGKKRPPGKFNVGEWGKEGRKSQGDRSEKKDKGVREGGEKGGGRTFGGGTDQISKRGIF